MIVYGQVSVYERDGAYQLYAAAIRRDGGMGRLYEQFEALKKKLEAEGLFDASRKKPVPEYVQRLGVVTARTGAAIRDIINVSKRRNPGIQIVLYPATVQGDGAADTIAAGIRALDALGDLDVIIVGRGGGSIEDLWAFNEEKVARAISACRTTVISAVGHETDVTIADFVADLRAPTPSAGAELAVSDMMKTALRFEEIRLRQYRLMRQITERCRKDVKQYHLLLQLKGPEGKLRQSMQYLAHLSERMDSLMKEELTETGHRLERYTDLLDGYMNDLIRRDQNRAQVLGEKLKALSPQAKLDAGYAYIENARCEMVSSVKPLREGDELRITLRDGLVESKVLRITANH